MTSNLDWSTSLFSCRLVENHCVHLHHPHTQLHCYDHVVRNSGDVGRQKIYLYTSVLNESIDKWFTEDHWLGILPLSSSGLMPIPRSPPRVPGFPGPRLARLQESRHPATARGLPGSPVDWPLYRTYTCNEHEPRSATLYLEHLSLRDLPLYEAHWANYKIQGTCSCPVASWSSKRVDT